MHILLVVLPSPMQEGEPVGTLPQTEPQELAEAEAALAPEQMAWEAEAEGVIVEEILEALEARAL